MLEEERMSGGARSDVARLLEENPALATGTILASALAAAAIVYLLRRSRKEARAPTTAAERAWDRARELVGDERLEAGREFVVERLLPELKPVLLAMLRDFEEVADRWFRQAEQGIKRL